MNAGRDAVVSDPLDVHTPRADIRRVAEALNSRPSLRYLVGEGRAQAEMEQEDPREIVALGCVSPSVAGIIWFELENSARRNDRFEVTDSEMRRVIAHIVEAFPGARAHVLWHSHYVSDKPSALDISTFPEWLVGVGIVYHAPTGTSHAYDETGVIIQDTSATSSPN